MNNNNLIKIFSDLFVFVQKSIPSISLAVIVILIFTSTILRYFFNKGILGVEEVVVIFGLYLRLIGASCSSMDQDHIKVNILENVKLSNKFRNFIKLFSTVISICICFLFFYISIQFGLDVGRLKLTIPPLGISKLFIVFSLIIGFFLMFFHETIRFLREIYNRNVKK